MTAVRSMVDGMNEEVLWYRKAYGHFLMSIYFVHESHTIDLVKIGGHLMGIVI